MTQQHDPSAWEFRRFLAAPEFHLHETFRNLWPVLYWLMRLGDSILEVGAGSGRGCILSKRLRPDKRVVAVDCVPETCQVIQEYAALASVDIEVRQADALQLPFRDQEFGVAFSVGMLEHYPDEWIRQAIKEQCRVAEVVVVSVPLAHYIQMFRTSHGDERQLSKTYWLELLLSVAPLAELSFCGDPIEEYWLVAILKGGAAP